MSIQWCDPCKIAYLNFSIGLKRYDFEIPPEVWKSPTQVFVEHDHGVEEATKVGKHRWCALLPAATTKKVIKVHEQRSGWEEK